MHVKEYEKNKEIIFKSQTGRFANFQSINS